MAELGDNPRSGPLLQLLASGLQFWIRQQCEAVESLDLQLNGSGLGLLRGRLEGVSLTASGVVFSQLELAQVELRSEPIRVTTAGLLKGQPLQLEHAFEVCGSVALGGAGLERSFAGEHWRPLGDQLARELLDHTPLRALRIEAGRLVLEAGERRCTAQARAVDGRLELVAEEGERRVRLPGDPAITIETAELKGDRLELRGRARVSP
ncbi:MAG: hypothetical protein RLZZ219_1943 [Cyanobacteriota bacterium]|jgi:hypothetical protein